MSPINYRSRLHGRDVLRAVRNRIVLHPHYFRDHSYYAGELHTQSSCRSTPPWPTKWPTIQPTIAPFTQPPGRARTGKVGTMNTKKHRTGMKSACFMNSSLFQNTITAEVRIGSNPWNFVVGAGLVLCQVKTRQGLTGWFSLRARRTWRIRWEHAKYSMARSSMACGPH